MSSRLTPVLFSLAAVLLAACSSGTEEQESDQARWVRVATVELATQTSIGLSGTVRARFETPVSFLVGGLISERLVDAGQRVDAEQVLFNLDPRDLEQAVRVARADLDTAVAELATAEAESRRNRDLLDREFISDQAFEQVDLAEKASRERVDAARARLEQVSNALEYGTLIAPSAGVLIEVIGEPGQVVAAGEPMATIAVDGPREVEVFLPEAVGVPEQAQAILSTGEVFEMVLREVAGAADTVTRTWSARYRFVDPSVDLRLGSVIRLGLDQTLAEPILQVPVAAINERGQGAQLWQIVDGQARPLPVRIIDLDAEYAQVIADIEPGAEVIALGTHLLQDGMAVRALPASR
ncbi:MAG: efflux RND transporter periplasmic adaptor subunit [Pseudomonadota bacterium]